MSSSGKRLFRIVQTRRIRGLRREQEVCCYCRPVEEGGKNECWRFDGPLEVILVRLSLSVKPPGLHRDISLNALFTCPFSGFPNSKDKPLCSKKLQEKHKICSPTCICMILLGGSFFILHCYFQAPLGRTRPDLWASSACSRTINYLRSKSLVS